MISFTLSNGIKIIPTSFHGSKFSDGTVFSPSEEEIEQIKAEFACLTVAREFATKELPIQGISASTSWSTVTEDGLAKLRQVQKMNPEAIILVSFMIVDALCTMGIKDEFPLVLSTNATPATTRSAPQDKVWDIGNFSAGR